jgi:hypothetical protein
MQDTHLVFGPAQTNAVRPGDGLVDGEPPAAPTRGLAMTDPTALPTHENSDAADVDDLDVDGHGLKEIAAGLSTVAVLATGAAGLAQMTTNTHSANPGGSAGGISASVVTPAAQTDLVNQVKDGVTQAAQGGSTATQSAATSVTGAATTTYGQAVDTVAPVVLDPIGSTDRAVDQTLTQARTLRDGAITTATTTATTTAAAVSAASRDGQHQIDQQMAGGSHQVAQSETEAKAAVTAAITAVHGVTQAASSAADQVRTTVVSLTHVTGGGSVDATTASGTVTIQDGDAILGTATVKDGQATIHWVEPATGGHTLVITYQGDAAHAPSSAAL